MEKDKLEFLTNFRKYCNLKKEYLLNEVVTGKNINILDIAIGRGGDLWKYNRNKNIKNVLGIEIDKKSVQELKVRLRDQTLNYNLDIINKSILDPYIQSDISLFLKSSHITNFNLVVCNFALNYFCDPKNDYKDLKTVFSLINTNLTSGGMFIGICANGDFLKSMNDTNNNVFYFKKNEKDSNKYEFQLKTGEESFFESGTVEEFLCFKNKLKDIGSEFNMNLIKIEDLTDKTFRIDYFYNISEFYYYFIFKKD